MTPEQSQTIDAIVRTLAGARRLFFVTGAGLSAESGLPTYRGVGGLYDGMATEDGLPIEEVLSGQMFHRHPEVTWKYLFELERTTRSAVHSRAHRIIAEMESVFDRVLVLTQNVDGFHRAAGSEQVIEIHGDCREIVCIACGARRTVSDYSGLNIPPRCCRCGGLERPDVVLFGEMLPVDKIERLFDELEQGFDVYFSIGTTSVFPYIREPIETAAYQGLPTVEINPGTTQVSHCVRYKLGLKAGEALEAIWSRFQATAGLVRRG